MIKLVVDKNVEIAVKKIAEYRRDFDSFCKDLIFIVDDYKKLIPFRMNKAQQYAHDIIENQKAKTGKVRVISLKGRQMGMSSYVERRFMRSMICYQNTSAFIMAHEGKATTKLFTDYKKIYDLVPNITYIKPSKKNINANIISFKENGSELNLGTAGSEETGRSFSNDKLHGSEVAFWPNGDKILAGLFNTVAPVKGTEIILESTANGMGNTFYRMCMSAYAGKGEYELIFTPWWWSDKYQTTPLDDWNPSEEDWEYYDNFMSKDIKEEDAPAFLYWRYNKIITDGDKKFKQEYPANVMEAFQSSGNPMFRNEWVECAINTEQRIDYKDPLIIGVDAAEKGGDRTVLLYRRGNKITQIDVYEEMEDQNLLAELVAKIIQDCNPAMVFFDKAYGYEAVKNLKRMGYKNVKAIAFNKTPANKHRFVNKRAEMHWDAKEWLKDGYSEYDHDTKQGGVDIPSGYTYLNGIKAEPNNAFRVDLAAIPEPLDTIKIQIESKANIKKDFGMSPDIVDAFILTFAEPISYNVKQEVKVIGGLNSTKFK